MIYFNFRQFVMFENVLCSYQLPLVARTYLFSDLDCVTRISSELRFSKMFVEKLKID